MKSVDASPQSPAGSGRSAGYTLGGEDTVHKFLIHNESDHVGVAVEDIKAGEEVVGVYMDTDQSVSITAKSDVPLGHKIALQDLAPQTRVLKYGIQIGAITAPVQVGEHVHTHNIESVRW